MDFKLLVHRDLLRALTLSPVQPTTRPACCDHSSTTRRFPEFRKRGHIRGHAEAHHTGYELTRSEPYSAHRAVRSCATTVGHRKSPGAAQRPHNRWLCLVRDEFHRCRT